MNETRASDISLRGSRRWLRTSGKILRGGLGSDVRSSLRVSVGFESSVALIVFYAVIGYMIMDAIQSYILINVA